MTFPENIKQLEKAMSRSWKKHPIVKFNNKKWRQFRSRYERKNIRKPEYDHYDIDKVLWYFDKENGEIVKPDMTSPADRQYFRK